MGRFFLEVSYKGSQYSGFQKQANANTIQAEVEKAFLVLQKDFIEFTGSSRTDAGVHAYQNYFHFDYEGVLHPHFIYKINAILPPDIVAVRLVQVQAGAHCRFDAISRVYKYYLYTSKNPFLQDRAYYFPYNLDIEKMNMAASALKDFQDFSTFSKRKTQVKTFICNIEHSAWSIEENLLIYQVNANRFLRGMVRGLTGTMLQVGRGNLSIEALHDIIRSKDCSKAFFDVPPKGLFLTQVEYPANYFKD